MLLATSCKTCHLTIETTYLIKDRVGLAQSYGESLELSCNNCGADNTYAPDDFRAINNVHFRIKLLLIAVGASIVISIIGLVVLDFYVFSDYIKVAFFSGLPFAGLALYIKTDNDSNRLFNRLKIKGHNTTGKISSTAQKAQIATVDKQTGVQSAINKMNKDRLPSNKK